MLSAREALQVTYQQPFSRLDLRVDCSSGHYLVRGMDAPKASWHSLSRPSPSYQCTTRTSTTTATCRNGTSALTRAIASTQVIGESPSLRTFSSVSGLPWAAAGLINSRAIRDGRACVSPSSAEMRGARPERHGCWAGGAHFISFGFLGL